MNAPLEFFFHPLYCESFRFMNLTTDKLYNSYWCRFENTKPLFIRKSRKFECFIASWENFQRLIVGRCRWLCTYLLMHCVTESKVICFVQFRKSFACSRIRYVWSSTFDFYISFYLSLTSLFFLLVFIGNRCT